MLIPPRQSTRVRSVPHGMLQCAKDLESIEPKKARLSSSIRTRANPENRTATISLIRATINLHAHCRRRWCHFLPSDGELTWLYQGQERCVCSLLLLIRVPSFSLFPPFFSLFHLSPSLFPNSSTVSIPSQAESLETPLLVHSSSSKKKSLPSTPLEAFLTHSHPTLFHFSFPTQ